MLSFLETHFFNTINKISTSFIDGIYPTFVLFTLVRFGVIIIPLPHIIVIILSFPFPLLQYNWGIRLLTVTDILFKGIDSHSIKLWLKYTSSNNYYYNTQKWKSKGEVGAYQSSPSQMLESFKHTVFVWNMQQCIGIIPSKTQLIVDMVIEYIHIYIYNQNFDYIYTYIYI
jgi:hypothetical protein